METLVPVLNREIFERELARIVSVFGDKHYAPERAERIYELMKRRPPNLFHDVVTRLIDTRRASPLPKDFLDVCDEVEREQRTVRESTMSQLASNSELLHRAAEQTKDPRARDLARERVKIVMDLQAGRINKRQFDEGAELIDSVERTTFNTGCPQCGDEGLVWVRDQRGYDIVCRCTCRAGSRHSSPMYAPSDPDESNPMFLPLVCDVVKPSATTLKAVINKCENETK